MKGETMAYKFTDDQKAACITAQLAAISRINDMFATGPMDVRFRHVDRTTDWILVPVGLAGKCGFSDNGGLQLVITDPEDLTCRVTLSLDGAKYV